MNAMCAVVRRSVSRKPVALGSLALMVVMAAGWCVAVPTARAQEAESRAGVANAAAGMAARPGIKAEDSLPIKRIVLYRSGVGYFQRQGEVTGDAQVELKFDVNQINDVLKSLQVLDLGGGQVQTVSYASKDPLERRLSSFSLQIGDNPSMPTLLDRLRGSGIVITTMDGQVSGTVLSVETRAIPTAAGGAGGSKESAAVVETPVVNVVTASGILSVPVPTIRSFTLQDKALAEELNKALMALAESRAEHSKAVTLSLAGQGSRPIVVAYVHETPVWKMSYRLVLPDDTNNVDAAKKSPQATLQGWAVVENTTDQDWTDVKLALVSGRPVSFQMDLYSPLYMTRPSVAVPTIPGVSTREYAMGMDSERMKAPETPPAPAAMPAGSTLSTRRGYAMKDASAEATDKRLAGRDLGLMYRNQNGVAGSLVNGGTGSLTLGESASGFGGYVPSAADMSAAAAYSAANPGEVGEVFQFEMQTPVTIERQHSAMIPIIGSAVNAQRVSIYNAADRADHPMRGVELTNSTSGQLLPGPLAVFDGAAYAGDAEIGQVTPGDKRLLAYAVDLDVGVITKPLNTSNVSKIKIVLGQFEQTIVTQQGMDYHFENKDAKRPRTIIVEHPRFDGYELRGQTKPTEQTQGLYRFTVSVDASKAADLSILQERTDKQMIAITSFDWDTLLRLQKDGKISEAVIAAMREIGKKQQDIAAQEQMVGEQDKQLEKLKQDQLRITQVMTPLDHQSDTYRKYLERLNKQETDIDTLSAKRAASQEQLESMRKGLTEALRTLSVD